MDDDFEEAWTQSKQEYTANSEELQSLISVIPTISKSQRSEYQRQGEDCLRSIEAAISDLTQALRHNRSSDSVHKAQYRQQLNVFKQQLKSQRGNFKAALQRQSMSSYSSAQTEERQGPLRGNEIVDSTQSALDRSKQILAETQDIATDTADKVNQQGLQLESVLDNVNEINETSDRARRIAMGMARRMMTDRIIQTVIVVVELGVVGGLLYWKFGT